MLTDTIRSGFEWDVEILSVLYRAEAAMLCALQELEAGRMDGAAEHLRIGLERVSRFLDEDA